MNRIIVFVDGENFIYKVEDILVQTGVAKKNISLSKIKLKELIHKVLDPLKPDKIIFYAARLHEHKETLQKSQELIAQQRSLKTALEKQGVKFVIAGNVRAHKVDGKTIFQEKGVDVKLAVDMVSLACHGQIETAVICSSDSDLQPAIAELRKEKVQSIYLGFELNPNQGLTATTNRTILFRNSEIAEAFK